MSAASLWSAVAVHLWQTSLVLAVLAILDRGLLRAPARWRARLWWIGVFKLAVPSAWVVAAVGALVGTSVEGEGMARVRLVFGQLDPVLSPAALEGSGWPAPAFTVVWALGAATLIAMFWRRGRAVRQLSLRPVEGALHERVAAAGIDPDRVDLFDGPGLPHLCGLVRPRIAVPASLPLRLADAELAAVLRHEAAHLRRRDPLRQLLLVPLLVAFWFYPPAWWLLRRLNEWEESACDEAVVASGVTPQAYSAAIARAIGHGLELPFAAVSLAGLDRGALARRLRALPELSRRSLMTRHRIVLSIAAIAAAVVLLVPEVAPTMAQERVSVESAPPSVDEALAVLGAAGQRRLNLVTEGPLATVAARIARMAGIDIEVDAELAAQVVQLEARNSTVIEVLRNLAQSANVRYVARGPAALSIAPGPRRVGGQVQAPQRLTYVPPEYPQAARDDDVEGLVIMEITVGTDGKVGDVTVLRGVRDDLDAAAVESARQWVYEPTLYNGQPVEALLTVTVQFQLQR